MEGFRADVNAALRSSSPLVVDTSMLENIKTHMGSKAMASIFVVGYLLHYSGTQELWDGVASEDLKQSLKVLMRDANVLIP